MENEMSTQPKTRITPQEYLVLEREAEIRSEYLDGDRGKKFAHYRSIHCASMFLRLKRNAVSNDFAARMMAIGSTPKVRVLRARWNSRLSLAGFFFPAFMTGSISSVRRNNAHSSLATSSLSGNRLADRRESRFRSWYCQRLSRRSYSGRFGRRSLARRTRC